MMIFGYYVGFKWSDFYDKLKLSDVKINAKKLKNSGQKGTKIIISELKNPTVWTEQEAFSSLWAKLSRLISPFEKEQDFKLYLTINGDPKNLIEVTKQITTSAVLKYNIDFDEKNEAKGLKINGKFRLKFLMPGRKDDKKMFSRYVENDSGKKFFDYLMKRKSSVYFNLVLSDSKKYFIETIMDNRFLI
jgi:hypothetical protein